jgi:hypothetical protein
LSLKRGVTSLNLAQLKSGFGEMCASRRRGNCEVNDQEEEFYEDFGAQPPTNQQVDEMIVRARSAGDIQLRQLLKFHLTLRYVSEHLLQRVEATVEETDDALLKLARFIIRGEGGIGTQPPLRRPWWKFW